MKPTTTSRRSFLRNTAGALALPTIIPSRVLGADGAVAPSNRIHVAAIGIGPRGRLVLDCFLRQADAQVITVCDVQATNRRTAKMLVDKAYQNQDCQTSRDMLEVLARDDIDAVLIATGDRWHAVGSMLAARAGKDVYSEKPCTLTIAENRELDETMKLYGRVFQAGTQRRSVSNFQEAYQIARSGKLGRIHTVHASINEKRIIPGWLPEEPLPAIDEVDWDRWLGPSPWRPYNKEYVRGRWRGHNDFESGAHLLDWGVHTVDLCQWALGKDGTTPVEFDPQPDGETIHARYADGVKLILRLGGFKGEGQWLDVGTCPVRYEGDQGWVEAGDNGKIAASPAALLSGKNHEAFLGTDPIGHVRNFLDCVKSRAQPVCHAGNTRSSHVACHAAAIARHLGRKLTFDPATETFVNDQEANRYRSRARRAPWHA